MSDDTVGEKGDKKPFRRANPWDREILANVTDPALRRQLARHLRDKVGVIVLPEEVDYTAFSGLMESDPELRAYVERADDPYLVCEYLLRRHPRLFLAVEQVLEVVVDWKIRRTKRGIGPGDDVLPPGPPPLPSDFYDRMSDDEVAMHVRRRLRTDVRTFNRDPEGYLASLRANAADASHPNERAILERLSQLFEELRQMTFPDFHAHIKGSVTPFPSMHARVWIRQMQERGNALICGDVGTQKTSAAVVGLHLLGARRVVVISPSLARLTWQREIPAYFRETPSTRVLEGADDLERLGRMGDDELHAHRYLVIGFGDLQCKNGTRWVETLARYAPDAVIIDEAHAIKHDVARTRQVLTVARLPSIRHRVMLTATPFENAPNEVAYLAMLLAPEEFPSREHFTAYCRNNPRFFYGLMAKLMCEYFASEDVLDLPASNVDRFNPFPTEPLVPSKELTLVHDMIRHDGALAPTEQIMRMNQLLACPFLGRDWYRLAADVNGLFRDPEKSVKLRWMRDEITACIRTGKVVIASGLYAAGVTRELADAEEDAADYVVADLLEGWFPGQVLRIDGSMDASPHATSASSRAEAIRRWKEDPGARILVASVQAAAESIDLTLRRAPGIEHCSVFALTLPWKPTQLIQFIGRFRRPGMEVPTRLRIPIVTGTVDEAMLEMNRLKWRNFLIGVMGIPLIDEEAREIERRIMSKFLETDSDWYGEVLGKMRGAGEERIRKIYDSRLRGKEVGRDFARVYLQKEECSLSGDASRFCAQVYAPWLADRRIAAEEMLDAGCGPLVLERRLGAPVYGVDINPEAIALGAAHSYHAGKHAVVGRLSALPEEWSGAFRLTVAALAIMWSSNGRGAKGAERGRILGQLARVTAVDGLLHLLLPATCFVDSADALAWADAVGSFGFERVDALTGLVESVDTAEEPRPFWSVCLRRTADSPETHAGADALAFAYERARGESKDVRPPRRGLRPARGMSQVKHGVFTIAALDGEHRTPEAAGAVVSAETMAVDRLVNVLRKRHRPTPDFVRVLRRSLASHRKSANGEYARRVWDDVFTRPDAPKVKRADWRALLRQAQIV